MNIKHKLQRKLRKKRLRREKIKTRKHLLYKMNTYNKNHPASLLNYGQTSDLMRTGNLTENNGIMNADNTLRGGENKMTDEQTQRLAQLQATEILAEEEKPVLDALITLQTATQALADAKAVTPVDPIAVAQQAVDDATAAYDAAEAAFKATQTTEADATETATTDATANQAEADSGGDQVTA